jgi:hypothetical protein
MTTEQEIKNKISAFRPTSQKVNLFDPNLNDKSTLIYKFKDEQDNRYKIWIFSDRIKLETPLLTSLLFSINISDKVCLANKSLKEINGVGKIFTGSSKNNQIQSCIELLTDDLKSLKFNKNEGLTVYGNLLQLTLSLDRHLIPEIEVCKKIKTLIELNFPDKVNDVDYSDLPTDLKNILITFGSLAITDDFERNEKIQELTKKQRSDLVKSIEPKFEEINAFLDTFGDKPLTDGAIGLQCLAELVTELINEN